MDDTSVIFIIVGGLISIIAIICFFILCNNVSKILEYQKGTFEVLKRILAKLPEKPQKEDNGFDFMNK